MVIKNTFSGTIDSTKNSVSESIKLPLVSSTTQNSITHYPVWSKLGLNAIYKTLTDAGYSVTKNETDYSITVLGFKFYVLSGKSGSSVYLYIYRYGNTNNGIAYGSGCFNYYTSSINDYKFVLTVRGNDDMFEITFSSNSNLAYEYYLLTLAKATYIPTKADAFFFMMGYTSSYDNLSIFLKSDLYTDIICGGYMYNIMNSNLTDSYKKYCCIGTGYIKIPLITTSAEVIIKGAIVCLKSDSQLTTSDNYYKIGNEIYYCSKAKYPYLIKVDTVTS